MSYWAKMSWNWNTFYLFIYYGAVVPTAKTIENANYFHFIYDADYSKFHTSNFTEKTRIGYKFIVNNHCYLYSLL